MIQKQCQVSQRLDELRQIQQNRRQSTQAAIRIFQLSVTGEEKQSRILVMPTIFFEKIIQKMNNQSLSLSRTTIYLLQNETAKAGICYSYLPIVALLGWLNQS